MLRCFVISLTFCTVRNCSNREQSILKLEWICFVIFYFSSLSTSHWGAMRYFHWSAINLQIEASPGCNQNISTWPLFRSYKVLGYKAPLHLQRRTLPDCALTPIVIAVLLTNITFMIMLILISDGSDQIVLKVAQRIIYSTPTAPLPIGPYNQAVQLDNVCSSHHYHPNPDYDWLHRWFMCRVKLVLIQSLVS